MIVLMIVGIILAISLPSYREYVQRSQRADGQTALLDIASRQERFVAQNNTYTTDITGAAGLGFDSASSLEGYYNLSVAACGTGTIANCYQITAAAAGGQTSDSDCLTIGFSSSGVKSGTTDECW